MEERINQRTEEAIGEATKSNDKKEVRVERGQMVTAMDLFDNKSAVEL